MPKKYISSAHCCPRLLHTALVWLLPRVFFN